jgi:hypothetical protein
MLNTWLHHFIIKSAGEPINYFIIGFPSSLIFALCRVEGFGEGAPPPLFPATRRERQGFDSLPLSH